MGPWGNESTRYKKKLSVQEKVLNEQKEKIKEQEKIIQDMKFQQNQMDFKKQIVILEEIKQKQVTCQLYSKKLFVKILKIIIHIQIELERIQKIQYDQDKKIIHQTLKLKKANHVHKKQEISNQSEEKYQSVESSKSSNLNCSDNLIKDTDKKSEIIDSKCQKYESDNKNSFLSQMEFRAVQREKIKKERLEKKKTMELEKLHKLQSKCLKIFKKIFKWKNIEVPCEKKLALKFKFIDFHSSFNSRKLEF